MTDEAEPFTDRAGGWLDLMEQVADLHPITRACVGYHLWSLAGLGQQGDQMEAAVTAARIAASDGIQAAVLWLHDRSRSDCYAIFGRPGRCIIVDAAPPNVNMLLTFRQVRGKICVALLHVMRHWG